MKKDVYELTNPQKSIWFMENYFSGTTINNICSSGTIYGDINISLLKKAIYNVVRQNDSFRIHIISENSIPKQYISEFKEFKIDIEDIKNEEEIKQIEEKETKYKFEIMDSDLFKFKIAYLRGKLACVILTLNHLISDSWSMGIIIQEILRNYNSLINNETPSVETFSYVDYINAENKYKSSEKYQKDKKYWNDLFKTIPESSTIPSLKNNTSNLTYKANRLDFNIEKETVEKINKFCKENRFSVFNFFMSVFSIYLGNVSNSSDFVIGTPILNRTNYNDKHTTGMFVNVVPVRININNNSSFCDFTNAISKQMMQVLRHQKYSYNSVLEDLRKDHENIPNLYNILISYQITKAFDKKYGNYKTNWTFNNYCSTDFNIHISDINDTGNLVIDYDYLIDKYDDEFVNNLHLRIIEMINQVLENNQILNNDIEIVTKEEKRKLLYDFNNTYASYPRDKTISMLFEEQVRKTPNNTAVVFENQKLTYKELNEKANSLAWYLKYKGLNENEVVSLFLDKSLESIISILGILKCRCAYMPIDIDYPSKRIDFMIKNSNSKFILSTKNLTERISNYSNIINVDLDNKEIYSLNTNNLNSDSNSEDLAYIMYTSGSTGEPKGVMVSNKNVVRLVKNQNYIKFNEHERILQTGSIVFDACTFEIWGSLLNGFELYIIKKQDLLDPNILEKYLKDNKITVLWVTAPLFNQLSEYNPKLFNQARVLLTGGDVLSPKHINAVKKCSPNLTIINGYGPTENTTFSTCFTIDKEYKNNIPIGYPITNSTCYVVSNSLNLMPIGVPGELLVGGDGVSKGYLNKPDFTKSRFIKNVFGDGVLYKTGDLVRWNKDGSIEFIGRIDNQVKIRGFRVELSEINLAVQNFEGIKECITIIKEINNEKVICTYFSSNEEININKLKTFLAQTLPNYSIPSYYIPMDSLPINTNGKIDRAKLPEPQMQNEKKNILLPKNEIEKNLIDLLKKLLNVDSISMDDNFFELGGDSLLAINLCSHIQTKFNTKLYVRDLLEHPQIQELSDIISNNSNTHEISSIKPIAKAEFYPVSSAQKRIFFTSKLAGNDSILYNIPGRNNYRWSY